MQNASILRVYVCMDFLLVCTLRERYTVQKKSAPLRVTEFVNDPLQFLAQTQALTYWFPLNPPTPGLVPVVLRA